MGRITVRIDDDDQAILRKAKMNLSEIARNAFQEEARRIIQDEALKRLGRLRAGSKPAKVPSEQIVREMRDAE